MAGHQPAGGDNQNRPHASPSSSRRGRLRHSRLGPIAVGLAGCLVAGSVAGFLLNRGEAAVAPGSMPQAIAPSATTLPTLVASDEPTSEPPTASGLGWLIMDVRERGRDTLATYVPGWVEALPFETGDWDDRHPAISADGEWLAWTSNREGAWDLYILQLSTGERRRLTDTPNYEGWPSWSPDGRWLAYESNADGDLDIWILAIDGSSAPIQLTNEPDADHSPAWDPQGRRIAFISDRSGQADIYLASLDQPTESRFVNLTNSPQAYEEAPSFTPDGRRLAFGSRHDGNDLLMVYDLAAGLELPAPGQGTSPAWSPDGYRLWGTLRFPNATRPVVYHLGGDGAPLPGVPLQAAEHRAAWLSGSPPAWLAQAAQSSDGSTPAAMTNPEASPGRMTLVSLPGVKAPNAKLSEAAAPAFEVLRGAVLFASGWDFLGVLDAAYQGLNDPMPPGWENASWLQTGRAFASSQDPFRAGWVEIVQEAYGGQMFWQVWVRAAVQDGTMGEPLRSHPWDLDARAVGDPTYYDIGGAERERVPAGYYVDFTRVARDFGFERLPALANWRTYYQGARANEFVKRDGLSWEQAMLQLYPSAAIATPTAFRTPTMTPTITPRPTATPYIWRWRTATPSPAPLLPTATPTP
jgi:TolB protein